MKELVLRPTAASLARVLIRFVQSEFDPKGKRSLTYGEMRDRAGVSHSTIGIGRPLDEIIAGLAYAGLPTGLTLFVTRADGQIDREALDKIGSGAERIEMKKAVLAFDWSLVSIVEQDR